MKPTEIKKASGSHAAKEKKPDRDWRKYHEKRVNEESRLWPSIRKVIQEAGVPEEYEKLRSPKYSFHDRIACFVVKIETEKSYLETESYLKNNYSIRRQLGIQSVPDHNTIWRTNFLLSKKYFKKFLKALFREKRRRNLGVDGSGFSRELYRRWMKDRNSKKNKDYTKLHLCCDVEEKLVTSFSVSNGRMHDSKRFPRLIRDSKEVCRIGDVSGDKAYPSRKNAQLVEDAGGTPYLKLKKNATARSKGFPGWRHMVKAFMGNNEEWLKKNSRKSIVESIFSWLKRKFGSKLAAKNFFFQRHELAVMLLLYNLHVLL